jgi:hypothetical protein
MLNKTTYNCIVTKIPVILCLWQMADNREIFRISPNFKEKAKVFSQYADEYYMGRDFNVLVWSTGNHTGGQLWQLRLKNGSLAGFAVTRTATLSRISKVSIPKYHWKHTWQTLAGSTR